MKFKETKGQKRWVPHYRSPNKIHEVGTPFQVSDTVVILECISETNISHFTIKCLNNNK